MNTYQQYAESVQFTAERKIASCHPDLQFGGAGRSAVVFRIQGTNKALKVFYPGKTAIAKEEGIIYKTLKGIAAFPALYEAGDTYIVIDWIEGKTWFQCLAEGEAISAKHIKEADDALTEARRRGLNPSDVHLRNMMITRSGMVMIVDVARFRQEKPCMNWEDIKIAHTAFYTKRFFPKKWPARLLNTVGLLYKKRLIPVYRLADARRG